MYYYVYESPQRYDAVTIEGKLQWQSALTALNQPFLQACDGIFLNYTWKEGTPEDALGFVKANCQGKLPSQARHVLRCLLRRICT